jgi:hypothetical protein
MRACDHRSDVSSGARRTGRGSTLLRLFWLLVALAAFWSSACQIPPTTIDSPEPWAATPPFFVVEAGDGANLHLLGTIHVGPAPGWIFPEPIEAAIRDARALVMEIDLRQTTEESISQAMVRHGILPAETPLSKLVSPETARLLDAHVREAMQPWLIMSVLVETMLAEADYSPARSVEEFLLARLDDRELIGLETVDEQLAFLGDLPMALQEIVLQETLVHSDTANADLEALIRAWRENDSAELLRFAREGADEFPELHAFYDVILDGRNRDWLAPLVELLEDPARQGTSVLVAVGALHLVGPSGLPNLLEEAGYAVRVPDLAGDAARPVGAVERGNP